MRRITTCLTGAALLLLGPEATHAQRADSGTVRIELHHTQDAKGELLATYPDGRTQSELPGENAVFRLGKDQNAWAVVADPNPLLFSYSSKVTQSPSQGLLAIRQFIEALKPLKAATQPEMAKAARLAPNDALPPCDGTRLLGANLPGLDLLALVDAASEIAEKLDKIPDYIDASTDSSNRGNAQTAVLAWQANDLERVLQTSIDQISPILKEGSSKNGLIALEFQYCDGTNARSESHQISIFKPLDLAQPESEVAPPFWVVQLEMAFNFVWWELRLNVDRWRQGAEMLVLFQQTLSKVGQPITLENIRFDPRTQSAVTIEVTESNAFEELLSADAKIYRAAHKGTFKANLEPAQKFHLAFAPAAVYSFVRDPVFTGVEDDDGKFTITETSDDYKEFDFAAMLHITPDRYAGWGTEPFLQIGIAPNSENLAFLLGAGFNFYGDLNLAAGVIYQRVNRLAPDLEIGQTIDTLDALKTDDEFKTGLYIQINYAFDIGGN